MYDTRKICFCIIWKVNRNAGAANAFLFIFVNRFYSGVLNLVEKNEKYLIKKIVFLYSSGL